MSDEATRIASAVADKYAIDREIGRGGMATVYLARDIRHNRNVALKVLNPELGAVNGTDGPASRTEAGCRRFPFTRFSRYRQSPPASAPTAVPRNSTF